MENNEEATEKILEKIRKIMELSERGSTEAERDTAMLQAQKLLDKYNLDMSQVESKDPDKKYVVGEEIFAMMKSSLAENSVNSIIQNFYNVKIIIHKDYNGFRAIKIYGKSHNVKIACYMQPWLMGEFDNRWQEYKYQNDLKGTKYKNTYLTGLTHGLSEKLRAQREELVKQYSGSTDLAVLDETKDIFNWIKESMDVMSGNPSSAKVRDHRIARDGFTDGQQISLNTQVEA